MNNIKPTIPSQIHSHLFTVVLYKLVRTMLFKYACTIYNNIYHTIHK